jgi:hypothetical protein
LNEGGSLFCGPGVARKKGEREKMINLNLVHDTGIVHCKFVPPMSVLELQQLNTEINAGNIPGITLDMPQFVDVTAVNLLDHSGEEIKAAVWNRAGVEASQSKSPMAVVVQEGGSFGMARMFAIRYDLAGIRNEEDILISESAEEAACWLLRRSGIEALDAQTFLSWVRETELDLPQPAQDKRAS